MPKYWFEIKEEISKCGNCPLLVEMGMYDWLCPITGYEVMNVFKKSDGLGSSGDYRPALAELFKQCPLKPIKEV